MMVTFWPDGTKPVVLKWVICHLLVLVKGSGGLMVSALVSGLSSPGSRPDWGHCIVFLVKTLYSHSASLHPGV